MKRPRHIIAQQRADDLAMIADIILTTGGDIEATDVYDSYAHGDKMTLRCIPVCSQGVPAVMPATQPLQALLAKETKLERQGRRLIPRRRPHTVLP